MAARLNKDGEAWLTQPSSRLALPLLLLAASLSAALVFYAIGHAALAAGFVSLSPSSAADITQTAADFIFQGQSLSPVLQALSTAKNAGKLVRLNFALAFLYNAIAIPFAIAGFATPLFAAIAMSSSSLVVTLNALRLRLMK